MARNFSASEVGCDSLRLATVGDTHDKRITFSAPIWASLVPSAVAWMATSVSFLGVIPVQPVFRRKVADGAAVLAAAILLGGMVLQNVTS